MRVLFICDDVWHPAEIIEMGLKGFSSGEFEIDIIKSAKDILTPKRLTEYNVIVNCKGNVVNSANSAPWFEKGVTEVCVPEFIDYIGSGGGFISLHAGNTFPKDSEYALMTGCYFISHPPRCTVEVKMTGSHKICDGINDFVIRDEHYNIGLIADDADIFCGTLSDTGGNQTGGYTRLIKNGRLCVLTPGHTVDVWYNEGFRRLLTNCIRWCAKKI